MKRDSGIRSSRGKHWIADREGLLLCSLAEAADGLIALLNGFEPCFRQNERDLANQARQRIANYLLLSRQLQKRWKLRPARAAFVVKIQQILEKGT